MKPTLVLKAPELRRHARRIADYIARQHPAGCAVVPGRVSNPTLVAHGLVASSRWHILTHEPPRKAVADLYVTQRATAIRIARLLSNLLGQQVDVLDNTATPADLKAHPRTTVDSTASFANPSRRPGLREVRQFSKRSRKVYRAMGQGRRARGSSMAKVAYYAARHRSRLAAHRARVGPHANPKGRIPAYITDDAARLAARPEIRQWAQQFITSTEPIDWIDFDAAAHNRGFSGGGKMAAELFRILYGQEPFAHAGRLYFRRSGPTGNPRGGEADEQAARELVLFVDNDAELYRQQRIPILMNLWRKMKAGKYDHEKAIKLWGYLAESGAKKYAREFDDASRWAQIFSPATRRLAAAEMAEHGRNQLENREFSNSFQAEPVRFKDLKIGDTFDLKNQPYGAMKGPWRKATAKTYTPVESTHVLAGQQVKIGATVQVVPLKRNPSRSRSARGARASRRLRTSRKERRSRSDIQALYHIERSRRRAGYPESAAARARRGNPGQLHADGTVHMTRTEYAKVHRDYRGRYMGPPFSPAELKGKPNITTMDPKTGATILVPVTFTDARGRKANPGGRVPNSTLFGRLTMDELRDVTEIEKWFERDRKHIELRWADDGETIAEWWDEDVDQAVEDGFLNPKDWHGSALEYSRDTGLLEKSIRDRRTARGLAKSRARKNPSRSRIARGARQRQAIRYIGRKIRRAKAAGDPARLRYLEHRQFTRSVGSSQRRAARRPNPRGQIAAFMERPSYDPETAAEGVLRDEWRVRKVTDRDWQMIRQAFGERALPRAFILEHRYIRRGVEEPWRPFDMADTKAATLDMIDRGATPVDASLRKIHAKREATAIAEEAAEAERFAKEQAEAKVAMHRQSSGAAFERMAHSSNERYQQLAEAWNDVMNQLRGKGKAFAERAAKDPGFHVAYYAVIDAETVPAKAKAIAAFMRRGPRLVRGLTPNPKGRNTRYVRTLSPFAKRAQAAKFAKLIPARAKVLTEAWLAGATRSGHTPTKADIAAVHRASIAQATREATGSNPRRTRNPRGLQVMPGARLHDYKPPHPERTSYRNHGGTDFDVTVREWPSAGAMQTALAMQSRRASRFNDWHPWPVRNPRGRKYTATEIRTALRTLTGEWMVMSPGAAKDKVFREIGRWAKLDKAARRSGNPVGRNIDRRSIRTVGKGAKRVLVGCPTGHYHPRKGRCDTGTRRVNPRDPAEEGKAAKTVRMFQDRGPVRILKKRMRKPKPLGTTAAELGKLVGVVYRSDKFDGKTRDYEHTFSDPKPSLVTRPEGEGLHVVGGRFKIEPDGIVN